MFCYLFSIKYGKLQSIKMSILSKGDRVILRDSVTTDIDSILAWNFTGEHLEFDAPWKLWQRGMTEEQIRQYKASDHFVKFKEGLLDNISKEKPTPRGNATIATLDNVPIGSLNRYFQDDNKDAPVIGISIKKDSYLNQGLGTEAFCLWVDYQFENSDIHRIGAETWSFNPRAIRLVEKVGFKLEGRLRELRVWEGVRLDKLVFGMLREEWGEINV